MKKDVTLTIDENLLAIAKKNIPNLSKFVTECLEAWLEYTDKNGEEKGAELREQWEKMNMAKVKIRLLLNDSYYEENIEQKIKNKKKSQAWRISWKIYRRGTTPDPRSIEETIKELQITEEELEDIMWDAYEDYRAMVKKGEQYNLDLFDNWEYIEENYLKR